MLIRKDKTIKLKFNNSSRVKFLGVLLSDQFTF